MNILIVEIKNIKSNMGKDIEASICNQMTECQELLSESLRERS
jgi:hypothetical protein